MLKVREINDFKFIGRNSWSNVLKLSLQNYIFQTYEYLSTWWDNFGKNRHDRQLFILIVEDGSSLAAIAPLMIIRHPLLGNQPIIQFIGTDICDYMDFIIDAERYEDCLLKILEYLSRIKYLELDLRYLPDNSGVFNYFNGKKLAGALYSQIRQVDNCPYVKLENKQNGAFDKNLSRRLLTEIKRNEKKLELRGRLAFKSLINNAPSKDILAEYFNMHVRKWSVYNAKYSQFQYKCWRDFIGSLCVSLAERGWLDFSYVELNKKRIAYHFGFRYNYKFYYYMPTFDPEFAAYSPSKTLIMKMLEHSASDGLEEFDFLRGCEPYKLAWTSQMRPVFNIYCYSKPKLLRYSGILRRKAMDCFAHDIKPKLKEIIPLMNIWYSKKRNSQ